MLILSTKAVAVAQRMARRSFGVIYDTIAALVDHVQQPSQP